ncbi:DUF1776-domain-containing protein [Delitschia confertaspora ATCC 74209]|uniref:DUF1776-domain-containing protein n=1 Tax=Delitschia confertaspora ATCC 74209 TaxID=1513339 RepID=A0A9P4JP49_9PLEO|nr:DUF1776-domain-containing protein [Delitschia confertaspora ATCC 74209]
MTSDDQHFLDVLSGYTQDIKKFTGDVFDASDRHFESVGSYIKEKLARAEWLPGVARPAPPPPPHRLPSTLSATYIERLQSWVLRNRALTAAIVAFFGTSTYLIYRENKGTRRKRRARRASNGARKEVIAIAGPASSPITKSLSLDLERRGHIVYIIVNSAEEEQQVLSESRVDIRPLLLDIGDTYSTQEAIGRFNNLLLRPHIAFTGASPHNLHFGGLILVPDLIYPSGPIETITPELWSDALNAKVLNTIATAQVFLPTVCDFKARVLVLTPNIVSSLRPAFHGVESTVVAALDGFTATLRAELGTLGIKVCQLKLGTFDCSGVEGKHHLQPTQSWSTVTWGASTRAAYSRNFLNQNRVGRNRGILDQNGSAGSSLRELHNAVFDALTQRSPRAVWRVGRGSFTYDVVGNWMPAGLVGWMLGVRRVSLNEGGEPQLEDSVQSWEKVETAV